MVVQDLPEVTTTVESKEQNLDLPDVPTKKPVTSNAARDDAEIASARISTKKRSLFLSLHTYTNYLKHSHTPKMPMLAHTSHMYALPA